MFALTIVGAGIMRLRLALSATFLAAVLVSAADAESSESEENMLYRIKFISGLSREEAERLVERVLLELVDKEEYLQERAMLKRMGTWQGALDKGRVGSASVMVADVDGDDRGEAIVAFSISWRGEGIVAVFRKQREDYTLCDQISCDGSPEVKAVDLLGNGKQALIIESLTGGAKWGRQTIHVYQWDKEKFVEIWEGITSEDGISLNGRYNTNAKVQFTDLDRDGIREIVRVGVFYGDEWEEQPELGEAQLPEIEAKLSPEDLKKLSKVKSGYGVVCKFRETYFYDREFGYYIQYKARVIQDMKAKANGLEQIPINAGTRVGVLGIFSSAYDRVSCLDSPIFVVLPDSRVVRLDKGTLERIYQEDQHGN